MLQARGCYRELQRLLMARERLQTVDQSAREAVSATNAIHDVRDVVVPAGEKLLPVAQAGRPAVVRRAERFTKRNGNRLQIAELAQHLLRQPAVLFPVE